MWDNTKDGSTQCYLMWVCFLCLKHQWKRQEWWAICVLLEFVLFFLKTLLEITVTLTILPVSTKSSCSQRGLALSSFRATLTTVKSFTVQTKRTFSRNNKIDFGTKFYTDRQTDGERGRERVCDRKFLPPPHILMNKLPRVWGKPAHSWDHRSLSISCLPPLWV